MSCGLTPAVAADVEFVVVQAPLLTGPTPRPSGPVAAGETEASVIATLPAVVTENVKTSEPFGARAPLNESVVELVVALLVDGDAGLPKRLLSCVQADITDTDASTRKNNKSWRIFMVLVSAPSRRLINGSRLFALDYSVPISTLGCAHVQLD